MSTSETDEYIIGKCPCGMGKVIKTVVTQDNPWSGADVSYDVDCRVCRADWDLSRSGDELTLRSSLVPSELAGSVLMRARQDLDEYIKDLASKYCTAQAFKTKKAEHVHLVGLGIFNGSYRAYLQDRKTSPMHRVGYPSRNSAFVDNLIVTYGDKQRHVSLLKAITDAGAAYKIAASQIVRQRVKL